MASVASTAAGSPPRIRALAGVLSNQIAAGEVIERPASVVKELIENSLDAAARRIHVEVEAGGIALVRVRDDGCGIHRDDLKLALSRHATSKIATLSDLERVRSFGFRGEALPSIASVSRLSLASRTADGDSGFEVWSEGASAGTIRPAALPPGTLVSVRDLFFNTPARRKFLRTERTEFRHLEDVIKRAALCRFDVGFGFHHNGREVFRLAPAIEPEARPARVARLLGRAFTAEALEVEIEGPGMTLTGWVGAPEAARAHSDGQYFFINGRAVRDLTARHAVRQALGERLATGRHPAYVLYLDLDPSQVDVNVHPAKHEVRFRETRLVHDFLWRGLARALDDAVSLPLGRGGDPVAVAQRPGAAIAAGAQRDSRANGGRNVADWKAVYAVSGDTGAHPAGSAKRPFGSGPARSPEVIAGRYAVSAGADGVAIVDLAESRRVMILHELGPDLGNRDNVSRPLLLPMSVSVEEARADRLERQLQALSSAGFDLRRSAPVSVTLRAVPACLAHVPAPALLDTILQCAAGRADPRPEILASALARAGGNHLEDLVNDAQAVEAIVRFVDTQPPEMSPRLRLHLDAAAIAALMRR